ncbi:manganese efflux pump MntP family protein [Mesorhizobium sp. NPDC059054]|uniref:manganese efflux pump MntP n=1 Tax=Mesorhizobium sp. NPDC059054 TaxID=3346711 RepID=UPI0036B00B7D
MSVDALIAALGRGASPVRPTLSQAVRTGLVFGIVEMLTPIIGWALGVAASQYIQAIDHWVAFILLTAVGGRMTIHALSRKDTAREENSSSAFGLLATAVGTSLDAMAVGVSLAFLNVNIFVIAAAIGLATMVMSTGGMLAGRYLGARFGRYAEIVGGLALIGLGAKILFDHLLAP